jgi:hypothetical protein
MGASVLQCGTCCITRISVCLKTYCTELLCLACSGAPALRLSQGRIDGTPILCACSATMQRQGGAGRAGGLSKLHTNTCAEGIMRCSGMHNIAAWSWHGMFFDAAAFHWVICSFDHLSCGTVLGSL